MSWNEAASSLIPWSDLVVSILFFVCDLWTFSTWKTSSQNQGTVCFCLGNVVKSHTELFLPTYSQTREPESMQEDVLFTTLNKFYLILSVSLLYKISDIIHLHPDKKTKTKTSPTLRLLHSVLFSTSIYCLLLFWRHFFPPIAVHWQSHH